MPRKWMFLAAAMVSMSVLTVGIAGADDEDSPLHKLMERVNAKNLAITKGVRTAVAFKKAQTRRGRRGRGSHQAGQGGARAGQGHDQEGQGCAQRRRPSGTS